MNKPILVTTQDPVIFDLHTYNGYGLGHEEIYVGVDTRIANIRDFSFPKWVNVLDIDLYEYGLSIGADLLYMREHPTISSLVFQHYMKEQLGLTDCINLDDDIIIKDLPRLREFFAEPYVAFIEKNNPRRWASPENERIKAFEDLLGRKLAPIWGMHDFGKVKKIKRAYINSGQYAVRLTDEYVGGIQRLVSHPYFIRELADHLHEREERYAGDDFKFQSHADEQWYVGDHMKMQMGEIPLMKDQRNHIGMTKAHKDYDGPDSVFMVHFLGAVNKVDRMAGYVLG